VKRYTSITGSSVAFSGIDDVQVSYYEPDDITFDNISGVTLTINFGALAAGAPVSGTVTFATSQGTVQGTFMGTISSLD
jgi:hypothetical protein